MKQNIKTVHVNVNGKAIELNDFVTTLFGNTVLGMVSSLRLDRPPKRIEVSVEIQPIRKRKMNE